LKHFLFVIDVCVDRKTSPSIDFTIEMPVSKTTRERSSRHFAERKPRVPLHIRVATRPIFGECWSFNVSSGGMAISAHVSHETAPQEGADIDVAFSIPDSGSRIACRARVAWVNPSTVSKKRVSFGITFLDMEPTDRASLARYLADYRPHVAIAQGSPLETRVSEEVLGHDVHVHRAPTDDDLFRLLSRGDISVVVVFGSDDSAAIRTVERIHVAFGSRDQHQAIALEPIPRVVYCASASAQRLIRLYNEGKLYQSLPQPVEPEVLKLTVIRACEDFAVRSELRRVSLELERAFVREKATGKPGTSRGSGVVTELVFESNAMRDVLDLIRVVAPHKAPVLLQGETGTGKELLARALHEMSGRADGPFVTLDCGTLTETLLESELFGHVAGAFTGAISDHPGVFQIADGGTLFLDEIENTTPLLQAKLLRVLESGEIRPVGGSRTTRVDVRVVIASNRELRNEVEAGRFRSDLFYRLNSFPVDVPPLRQRREDVLPLARHFLKRSSETVSHSPGLLTREAEQFFLSYPWPGNVRELRNAIERAVLLSGPNQPITVQTLPPVMLKGTTPNQSEDNLSFRQQVDGFERDLMRAALERHGGIMRQAAKYLRMNAVTFGRKAKSYGLYANGPGSPRS
jgi:DNA-binding NtrC family response regulator